MADRPDVVLVTIDCWRHDAVDGMDNLRARDDLRRGEAICQSAATPGVFPAIYASQWYPLVYDSRGEVRSTVRTLPGVLGDRGYDTAAFSGDNPFLGKFAGEFDRFWNGDPGEDRRERLARMVFRRAREPAPTVIARAREWFESASRPRFLHVHLMDPHEPYLPGLVRYLRAGPVRSYAAATQFAEDRQAMTPAQQEQIRALYRHCVDLVDAHVDDLLSFVPDDALLVLTGDHGEEFDHGAFRHARLYDECVRVPFFSRNVPAAPTPGDPPVRQLDLAPTLLSALGVDPPAEWEGSPFDDEYRDSFMLNHSPHREESYVGLRTDRYKLLRTLDGRNHRVLGTELYDLAADPGETDDRYPDGVDDATVAALTGRLESFLAQDGIGEGLVYGTGMAESDVEDRLEALGYV